MADTASTPRVVVGWPTGAGAEVKLEGERGYKSPADKSLLGRNVECYVAMGGTRLDKGFGDPHGAIVRVGLYKKDARLPFFEDIAEGGSITIRIDHVRMNQAVEAHTTSALMHERYSLTDLTSCGLDANARNLIITADPQDPIRARIQTESVRPGGLDGGPEHGKATATIEPDGSATITYTIPYALLRHIRDPNLRTKPGAFFEPQHFHVEMELVAAVQRPAAPPGGILDPLPEQR